MLRACVSWARRCQLQALKSDGQPLKDHLEGILGHFSSEPSTGPLKAKDGLIQGAKARVRGYRTDQCLILMADTYLPGPRQAQTSALKSLTG